MRWNGKVPRHDPRKKFRIRNVQMNLVVIFGMLLAVVVVSLFVFINLSAREIQAEKELYRVEAVGNALEYMALMNGESDYEELVAAARKKMPMRGDLYVLEQGQMTVKPDDFPYRAEDVLEAAQAAQENSGPQVLDYYEPGKGERYIFYAQVPDNGKWIFYLMSEQELLAGENTVAQPVIIAALVLLLISGIAIYVFSQYIIKPIFLIQKTIHGMVSGAEHVNRDVIPENHPLYPLYDDLNHMIEKYQNMVAKEYSTGIMKTQAELDALQSQINPHFLYNTLDSIRGIAIVQGARNIEVMIKALSDMFRYSISRKGPHVKLKEELANIQNYIRIQQYRFNDKFVITEQVDEDTKDCLIPKLIVQPIVENAVFHGLEPKQGKGHIMIRAQRTQKRLIIDIEDDGIGITREKLIMLNEQLVQGIHAQPGETKTHIGLFNVNKRIRLNYGEEYGLRIYGSENNGTTVEIVLPVQEGRNL